MGTIQRKTARKREAGTSRQELIAGWTASHGPKYGPYWGDGEEARARARRAVRAVRLLEVRSYTAGRGFGMSVKEDRERGGREW